jgi:Fe-S-cluster formation regulator IscX/YfhJ
VDFYVISTRETKGGKLEVFPDFLVGRFEDIMIRGHSVYAIWDESRGLWSTDEYDVQRLVDEDLRLYAEKNGGVTVKYLRNGSNRMWAGFQQHVANLPDSYHQLDENLTFANQDIRKTDYVSRRLPYALEPGDHSAWDELVGTLYSVEEQEKIEWAIGAIISGDAKKIQKFLVFYGLPGSGKGTILNIILKLFEGYTTTFDAKALGSSNGTFATEAFKNNPLVAVQHDGDLSKIEDNTRINSIVAHEDMPMNEKYKPGYTSRVNAFLFMGTNQPVKISDAKSGIIRRLIDVHPTGVTIPRKHYDALLARIDFELGAIAHHCLGVYRKLGKNYYSSYRPTEMMLQTDVFFNFIEATYDIFKAQDGTSLKQAYTMYKEWCAESGIDRPLPQYKFREELRNYFDGFKERVEVDGEIVRSYYCGFNANKYKAPSKNVQTFSLVMEETHSLFDDDFAGYPAQYATPNGTPKKSWSTVTTILSDIDTSKVHFVKVPDQHIVIDFDLKDDDGNKSLERNLEAASAWPPTYAEISKSGSGIHLHYNYDGDVTILKPEYSEGVEVKAFTGGSSLRRRLSKCNNVPIATMINTLPIKEKKMLGADTIKSEKGLRSLIARNLRREILPGTKPSVDFIKKILDEAFESGMSYDVTDLRSQIFAFATGSTNHAMYCIKQVQQMKFKSSDIPDHVDDPVPGVQEKLDDNDDRRLVFFDVEVYPNLFVVCWKYEGVNTAVVRMVNPPAQEVEKLLHMKLVGFNNRRYDNHILYAAYMGYDNAALYALSQKIIAGNTGAMFGEAYNLSYADIYDFSSVKQSLKRFMIQLGIRKVEMDIPWDKPVPEELWDKVVEYCVNDVIGTELTFVDREQDFVARQILAALSGLTVNDSTAKHTARIIFGNDRDAKLSFVYTDLSQMFPGYTFEMGKSTYRGEEVGEGGYVYADEGMYFDVAVLDVASMHPTSIKELNAFGEYTPNFVALLDARVAIKRGNFEEARRMLGGKLAPYLKNESQAKDLAYALKIVINTVYGLTAAKFDNPFRIPKNKDNIVAKRGALFMIDLKNAVQQKGYIVAHIKTDSIKIPEATPEIIQFVMDFGARYGYEFEHEATYKAFCLVNDAVYIAREGKGKDAHYTAVGAQFQHPYVFKTLFSDDNIRFDDYCEVKQVGKGIIYLDFTGIDKPQPGDQEKMQFVGKIGIFVPVAGTSAVAGRLWRVAEDKFYAVAGTKDYRWAEAAVVEAMGSDAEIDMRYFENLVEIARNTIDYYGPFEEFLNG